MKTENLSKANIVLALLFGLFMATDVVYIFGFGSTLFTISEVYSVILFVYLFVTKQIDFGRISIGVGDSFRFLLLYIAFSAFMAFATFLNVSMMYRYMVGVFALIITLTALVDMMSLFKYRVYVINGIELGLILNFIFVVTEYIVWKTTKSPYTLLYNLFPQSSFHMHVYNFGAEGLFLEPSHMIHFIASVLPLWIVYKYRISIEGVVVLIVTLYSVAMSGAGTSMVIWMSLLLLLLVVKRNWRYVKGSSFIAFWVFLFGLLIILAFFSNSPTISNFMDTMTKYLDQAFAGSNVSDSSNADRLESMTTAISLISRYPIGCGWNMVHTLLEKSTSLHVATAFSDIIEMTLELGVGVLFYIWFVINSVTSLFKIGTKESKGVAVALIAIFTMQCMADYAFNPCMMMVFGFARSIILEEREGLKKNEDSYSRLQVQNG